MLAFNSFFFVIITYLYIIVNLVITYGVVHSNEIFVFLIFNHFKFSPNSRFFKDLMLLL